MRDRIILTSRTSGEQTYSASLTHLRSSGRRTNICGGRHLFIGFRNTNSTSHVSIVVWKLVKLIGAKQTFVMRAAPKIHIKTETTVTRSGSRLLMTHVNTKAYSDT